MPAREQLPIPLRNPSIGYDYNRLQEPITLLLDTGFKPASADSVLLHLGFSESFEMDPKSEVRCNGQILHRVMDACGCALLNNRIERCDAHLRKTIPFLLAWRIPADCMNAGENVFELISFPEVGELRWAETAILPHVAT